MKIQLLNPMVYFDQILHTFTFYTLYVHRYEVSRSISLYSRGQLVKMLITQGNRLTFFRPEQAAPLKQNDWDLSPKVGTQDTAEN